MGEDRIWAVDWGTSGAKYMRFVSTRMQPGSQGGNLDDLHWGNPIPVRHLPVSCSVDKGRKPPLREDFFHAESGRMVISVRFAELLRQFDLGAPEKLGDGHRRVELHLLPLYDEDQTTQIADYVFMHVTTQKDCFVATASENFKQIKHAFLLRSFQKDGQLTLKRSALEGPDLWRDPNVMNGFFVSDRLKRAIEVAGIKPTGFTACKLVEA